MKLASVRHGSEHRLVAVDDLGYVDLHRARAAQAADEGLANALAVAEAETPSDIVRLLELGAAGLTAASAALTYAQSLDDAGRRRRGLVLAPTDCVLLPVVPRPPKMICIGRNYAEHAREAGREPTATPILFPRFAQTLVGHGAPVVRPRASHDFDWEGEVAFVIGRGGRAIRRNDALDHVAGYTLFNDVTARDFQFRTTQYVAGKNFDSTGPLGPYLVTADEVPDPHEIELTTSINGEEVQRGNTRDLLFDVPTIIESLSEWITLEPGDVVATGTPAGVGFTRTPPRFLVPGDVVRVEATGLGVLENPVVDES